MAVKRNSGALSELLVRVLAAQDAIFLPIRKSEWKAANAISHARQQYRICDGAAVVVGGSDRERKAGQRLGDQAVALGLVVTRHRGRTRYMRLTDKAEDRLRQQCGLPGLWLSFETLRRLPPKQWIREIDLNDGKGWGEQDAAGLRFVEWLMLPALLRGWADSGSTTRGHVYYRRLADPPEWPLGEEVEPEPELAQFYGQELLFARQRILDTSVSPLELGELPLPVGAAANALRKMQ
jgi:hypothetical protein